MFVEVGFLKCEIKDLLIIDEKIVGFYVLEEIMLVYGKLEVFLWKLFLLVLEELIFGKWNVNSIWK